MFLRAYRGILWEFYLHCSVKRFVRVLAGHFYTCKVQFVWLRCNLGWLMAISARYAQDILIVLSLEVFCRDGFQDDFWRRVC